MIQKQKLFDPQQWNMFQYARNNPLRFIDPTGMYTCDGTKAQCDAIEAARQRNLGSRDGDIRAAAKAYGDPSTDKNDKAIAPFGVDKTSDGIVNVATTMTSVTISKEVGVAIQASVERTLQPSGADTKGNFHEEGFTQDKDGTIHTAQSGPAFKPTDTEAHVNQKITSNTAIVEHTHPAGTKDGAGRATFGVTKFQDKPSDVDKRNAGSTPAIGQQILRIEASAGDKTVYFYDNKDVYAHVPLDAFPK